MTPPDPEMKLTGTQGPAVCCLQHRRLPLSVWTFSTLASWIIATQKDLWHRQPWRACPKQFWSCAHRHTNTHTGTHKWKKLRGALFYIHSHNLKLQRRWSKGVIMQKSENKKKCTNEIGMYFYLLLITTKEMQKNLCKKKKSNKTRIRLDYNLWY